MLTETETTNLRNIWLTIKCISKFKQVKHKSKLTFRLCQGTRQNYFRVAVKNLINIRTDFVKK